MSEHTFDPQCLKARKAYKCLWCGEPINKGDKHYRLDWIYDGEFNNGRWHLECLYSENNWKSNNDFWDEYLEPYQGIRGEERMIND